MERKDLITKIRQFFSIEELVCPHVYRKWGQRSWQFLDTAFLETLYVIRKDILGVPMFCNVGDYTQRGLRCNKCKLVANKSVSYLSAHVLGKAGDFSVDGMSAEEARQKIIENIDRLPHPIRMENGVAWLHIDVLEQYGIDERIHLFNQ
jgi:hypothetical protein